MECDREGTFRADIKEFSLYEAESGAVGVNLKATLTEAWNFDTREWLPWAEYGMEVEGCIYIVKKDGSPNTKAAESLIQFADWDGDINSIVSGGWQPSPCQLVIKKDTYKDEERFKIAFVNHFDSTPGGGGNVTADKARELADRHNSSFRALAADKKRNAAPVAKKGPPAPPPRTGGIIPGVPAAQTAAAMAAADKDGSIPF